MGLVWGARLCGHQVPERVAGVDLFHQLLVLANRNAYPVFLLGAPEEVVNKTAEVVLAQNAGLKLAGVHHGYFFWQ